MRLNDDVEHVVRNNVVVVSTISTLRFTKPVENIRHLERKLREYSLENSKRKLREYIKLREYKRKMCSNQLHCSCSIEWN